MTACGKRTSRVVRRPLSSRLATCVLAQGLDPTRHETKRGLRGICDPQGEAPAPGPRSLHAEMKRTGRALTIFASYGGGGVWPISLGRKDPSGCTHNSGIGRMSDLDRTGHAGMAGMT